MKKISVYRIDAGPPELRIIFEHHQFLWHLAKPDRRKMLRSERFDARFGYWDFLLLSEEVAGWCTQLMGGSLRSEEIARFLQTPALDDSGPFADWLARIETPFPSFFAHVKAVELMRVLSLKEWRALQDSNLQPPA